MSSILVALMILAICVPVMADIVASDDFESPSWVTNWSTISSFYSFPQRDSSQAHSGSYSAMMTNSNNGIWRLTNLASATPVAVRYWLYDTGSSITGDFVGIYDSNGVGTSIHQCLAAGMQNSGKTVYERRILTSTDGSGWADLTNAPRSIGWHRFDIYYNSSNYVAFYVDGLKQYENETVTPGYTLKYLRTGEQSTSGGVATGGLDDITYMTNPTFLSFAADNGTITVSNGGTKFETSTGFYDTTETLTLTATPDPTYHFVKWESSAGWTSTDQTATYTPESGDPMITAYFQRAGNPVNVTICPDGAGTVNGANYYSQGEAVTVAAVPAVGYQFQYWTDDSCTGTHVVSTSASYSFTMPANAVNLYAHFLPKSYNLTVSACTGGSILNNPSGKYVTGTQVTISAVAGAGYWFNGWTTDTCGGTNIISKNATYTLTMPPGDYDIHANFSPAQFVETFESYNTGGTSFDSLDKNDPVGPNQDANGLGNPWWGTLAPNGRINTSVAHAGTKSLWGTAGNCKDICNVQFRCNSGSPITDSVFLDWWFYDPLGSVGSTTDFCADYTALSFYGNIPAATDYPDPVPSVMPAPMQQLAIGMADEMSGAYDPAKYQVRIVGDSGGYANGWFNTTVTRSIGWHHARVMVGRKNLPLNTNDVQFFIDDMVNPVLGPRSSVTSVGYNVIEVNTIMPKAGSCSSANGCVYSKYFHFSSVDDICFGALSGVLTSSAASVGINQITWKWAPGSVGEAGFNLWDASSGGALKGNAPAGATSIAETGLLANTRYSRWVDSFISRYCGNVDGQRAALNPVYTLAATPVYGASGNGAITCASGPGSSSTTYTSLTPLIFTSVNGFGTGPAKASKYSYIVNSSPADPADWSGASSWTSGVMNWTPPAAGFYYVHLRAYNGDGVVNPASLTLGPYIYSGAVARINDLFGFDDNVSMEIDSKAVTATLPGVCFWIEQSDRTSALKVIYSGTTAALQDHAVNVIGKLDSSSRPRTLVATSVADLGLLLASQRLSPVGTILRNLGGSDFNSKTRGITGGVGRYNLGMLVRIAGSVTYGSNSDPNNRYFYINDGSRLAVNNGSGHAGVKVKCGSVTAPTTGLARVTGVIDAESTANGWVPVLIIRGAADVITQ